MVLKLAHLINQGLPKDDGRALWTDFVHTLWIALAFMVVRAVCNQTVLRMLRHSLAKQGKARAAESVFENFYVVVWSVFTEVLAVYITVHPDINGNCTPWSTDPCLSGWPNHKLHLAQKWYQILMFQFYLHEMIGAALGQHRMKPDMIVHHIATMGLIAGAYCLNLNRYAIMWQALFDMSNPLLHAAKGLHAASVPQLEGVKWMLFNLFALTFFVCRVAAAPYSILYPALTRSLSVLPHHYCYPLMVLMFIVCGMQWVWFYRIVMMALGRGEKEADEHVGTDTSPHKKQQ